MTTHTSGPWHVGIRTAHSKRDVYGPQGSLVALADGVFTSLAEAQANARLIAAAPELADALRELVADADLGEVDLEPEELAKLERARAILARIAA